MQNFTVYVSKTAWTLDSEGIWGDKLEPACTPVGTYYYVLAYTETPTSVCMRFRCQSIYDDIAIWLRVRLAMLKGGAYVAEALRRAVVVEGWESEVLEGGG